jgi:hypothetical protein
LASVLAGATVAIGDGKTGRVCVAVGADVSVQVGVAAGAGVGVGRPNTPTAFSAVISVAMAAMIPPTAVKKPGRVLKKPTALLSVPTFAFSGVLTGMRFGSGELGMATSNSVQVAIE